MDEKSVVKVKSRTDVKFFRGTLRRTSISGSSSQLDY